jgi:hypothetical protein
VDRPTIERGLEKYGLELDDEFTLEALCTLGAFAIEIFEICGRKLCLAGSGSLEIG